MLKAKEMKDCKSVNCKRKKGLRGKDKQKEKKKVEKVNE